MKSFFELRYVTKYGVCFLQVWPIEGDRDEQSILNEIRGFIEKNHNPKFSVRLERVTREPLHTITLEEFLHTIASDGEDT